MAPKRQENRRQLPKLRNPELHEDRTPDHSQLVKLRRLGQTSLALRPHTPTSNGDFDSAAISLFDYAHLRAPLPSDLSGAEILPFSATQKAPDSYYLMRRSKDGYVSATGMFKAAFPLAKQAEEIAEKEHIKTLLTTPTDEVAGNMWITEQLALELADEYGISPWIQALLDPADIILGLESEGHVISPPPKYKLSAKDVDKSRRTPSRARATTPKARGRPRQSSPEKNKSPVKRGRPPKTGKQSNGESMEPEAQKTEPSSDVNVDVETVIERQDGKEVTTTNVKVQMPPGTAQIPLPENAEDMIARAKEMVEEARKLDGVDAGASSTKRKADALEEDSDDEDAANFNLADLPPAKRARVLRQEATKAKVRSRAFIGVAVTMAMGALIPYLTG